MKLIYALAITLVILWTLAFVSLAWGEDNYVWDKNGMRAKNYSEQKLDKIEKTLDKMYSMLADLHIKFMGQERYDQIYDPDNEGEVAKQRRRDEKIIERLRLNTPDNQQL